MNAHVDVSVFVEPGQTLEWSFNVLCWYITDLLGFEDPHQPPITIAVVHQEQAISLDDIGLTLYRCCKAVQ